MHNNHSASALPFLAPETSGDLSRPWVRSATSADIDGIAELVSCFVAEGLMLPRTSSSIGVNIHNYIVAAAPSGIVACAALEEYSPSLAEVSSVAVARSHHGSGLGTQVVLGVERLARARSIAELFALSLSSRFFLSLDYRTTDIANYPEKVARYDTLAAAGLQIVPKPCFQKMLGTAWQLPQLMRTSSGPAERARRAS
ncbi:MAG: GNAT family N-acetyltransferase [Gemmatimonadaceae bacterium]|nr:GNAT family N-acetyltransferase [Gemmatimonadaceae bacterium]